MSPDSKRKFWLVFIEGNTYPVFYLNRPNARDVEAEYGSYIGYQEIEIDMERLRK